MNQLPVEARFLVVLDVDSTLIDQEVIEVLAEFAGKADEVAKVTDRTMAGELDFAGSLRARVKTLVGLPESVIEQTLAKLTFTKGAFELVNWIHQNGGKVGAVSGGFVQLVEPLAKQIQLDFFRANQLEIVNGYLTGEVIEPIIDKPAKATAMIEWAEILGLTLRDCIAIGDGANDLDMIEAAGLGIGFNAKPRVKAAADILIESGDLADAINLIGF